MKKILLTISLFTMTLMASAQEPVDKAAVDTQNLLSVLKNLADQYANLVNQYGKVLSELADLKAKANSCTCSGEGDKANLIDGTFSVSSTKKVQFTKANLYWDGSAYHFEANQTDIPESWNASHVGHFYWTSSNDYQSSNANYMPYAENYNYSSQSASDKFFCDNDNPLTVDGTSGCFALSDDEWAYLINTRTNANNLRKYGVTVGARTNCLIIAPDGFSGGLKSSYTLDEISSLGLVCLPAAGRRAGSNFNYAEAAGRGYYWSSALRSSNSYGVWYLYFDSDYVFTNSNYSRGNGFSVRLVRLPQ